MRSIAFSAVSTGVYGYPSVEAAGVVVDEVRRFLDEPGFVGRLERVVFCNFEEKDQRAYEEVIPYVSLLSLSSTLYLVWSINWPFVLTHYYSKYFPPTEQDLPSGNSQSKPAGESWPSPSPEILAPKLPDPPTVDPALDFHHQPDAKKQEKVSKPDDSAELGQSFASVHGTDDEWEEVEPVEKLDDEPVDVGKAGSVADVQSVQSGSVVDPDEAQSPVTNMLAKDW